MTDSQLLVLPRSAPQAPWAPREGTSPPLTPLLPGLVTSAFNPHQIGTRVGTLVRPQPKSPSLGLGTLSLSPVSEAGESIIQAMEEGSQGLLLTLRISLSPKQQQLHPGSSINRGKLLPRFLGYLKMSHVLVILNRANA